MSADAVRLGRRLSMLSDDELASLPLDEWGQVQGVMTDPVRWKAVIPLLSDDHFAGIRTAAFAYALSPIVARDLVGHLQKRSSRHVRFEVEGEDQRERSIHEVAALVAIHATDAFGDTIGTKLLRNIDPLPSNVRYNFLLGRLRTVVGSRVAYEFQQSASLTATNWEYSKWAAQRRCASEKFVSKYKFHHLGLSLGSTGEVAHLGSSDDASWTLEELIEQEPCIDVIMGRIEHETWIQRHALLVAGVTGTARKVETYARVFAAALDSSLPPDADAVGMSESGMRSARDSARANVVLAVFQSPHLLGLPGAPEGEQAAEIMRLMPTSARGKKKYRDLPWTLLDESRDEV